MIRLGARRMGVAVAAALALVSLGAGCGGSQTGPTKLDTRPLEEQKAFDVIKAVLAERGYTAEADVAIELTTKARFQADFRLTGQKIAIEYLVDQDRIEIGAIPPPATGSRLHVLQATTVPADPKQAGETLYIFFLDDRNYLYQFNPTSENRADITLNEVQSRLKRDVVDFLTWYEATQGKKTP
jgi:hypothetical protein